MFLRDCQGRQDLPGNRLTIGLKPYCGEKGMTHDAAVNFCYQRE